jgi:hypothetical protein
LQHLSLDAQMDGRTQGENHSIQRADDEYQNRDKEPIGTNVPI